MSDLSPSDPVLRNPLAETLAAGRLGIAMIVQKMHTVDIALAARSCGFDALSVDLEHSVISESAAAQICQTALQVGVTPLVRVPSHDAHYANRMLDAGACGIIAPHVSCADEAHAIVRANTSSGPEPAALRRMARAPSQVAGRICCTGRGRWQTVCVC